jgi:hypothetical protein
LFSYVVALIEHWNSNLTRDRVLTRDELALQSHYVNVLQEAVAQIIVNLEERSDYGMGEPFFNQLVTGHAPKMAR